MSRRTTNYVRYQFSDTEFEVPERYTKLEAKGFGAQGTVW